MLMLVSVTAFAQDIIYKTDATKIEAKVEEVGPETVKYRLFSNLSGPLYIISKSEIILIAYANGQQEIFVKSSELDKKELRKRAIDDTLELNKMKNIVSIGMFDFIFSNLSFAYERVFGKGYVAVKVPVFIGVKTLNSPTHYSSGFYNSTLFGGGLDLNYYPTGQGRVKYYVGPSVRAGVFRYWLNEYQYGPTYLNLSRYENGEHVSFTVNNGMAIAPSEHLQISMALGLGLGVTVKERTTTSFQATGLVNIGYRF